MEKAEKTKAKIEEWRLVTLPSWRFLTGKVYGHPIIADGKEIHTGKIISLNDTEAETLNTVYVLGKAGS